MGFFLGIDIETIISGGSENVNTTGFHHGSDFLFDRGRLLKVTRTFTFSGRSGCTCIGIFFRTRWQGCERKCFVETHMIGFFLKPNRDIR